MRCHSYYLAGLLVAAMLLAGCGGGAYVGDDGEELEIGESTTVEYDIEEATGPVEVALIDIEEGSPDDLDDVEFSQDTGGEVSYYLTWEVVNVDGIEFAGAELRNANAIDADGTVVQGASISGDLDPCPRESFPEEFNQPGATFEICHVALAEEGQEVVGGNFVPNQIESTTVWQ